MEYSKARALAKNLRKFALFIQDNADELPDDINVEVSTHLWSWDISTDIPITIGRAMRAAVYDGAHIKKEYSDSYFRCYMTWGHEEPKISWKVVSHREDVCEKKVVGTQTVTKMVAPKGDWTEQEVEEEIVEWKCHSFLDLPKTSGGDDD